MCVTFHSCCVLFLSRRKWLFQSDPSNQKLCQVLKKVLKSTSVLLLVFFSLRERLNGRFCLSPGFSAFKFCFFLKSEGLNTLIIMIKTKDLML